MCWIFEMNGLNIGSNPLVRTDNISERRKKVEAIMERFVIKNADRVISVVTDSIIDHFRSKYKDMDPKKIVCITNGFDAADFNHRPPIKKANGRLTFSFIGSFEKYSTVEAFFEALRQIINEDPQFENEVTVRFIGRVEQKAARLVSQYPFRCLEKIGYVSHARSIEYLHESDVALIFFKHFDGIERALSGKIFEYVATGKPTFAITPHGEIERFIKKHKKGFHALPDDVAGIKGQILLIRNQYKKEGKFDRFFSDEVLWAFERRTLTGQSANLFDEITSRKITTTPVKQMEPDPSDVSN